MSDLTDSPQRYGAVSRALHWGMALLFLAQFASALAHWGLERGSALRDALWSYHTDLGFTLFVLVLLRGVWGLANMANRPAHGGPLGQAARLGHAVLYGLMILVPGVRILAAAGSDRGLSYLGFQVVPPQAAEVAWMQLPAEWHGEMGWLLLLVILSHIAMAVGYHRLIARDTTLARMA